MPLTVNTVSIFGRAEYEQTITPQNKIGLVVYLDDTVCDGTNGRPSVRANTFYKSDRIGERSVCSFTLIDRQGNYHLTKGQPVRIENSAGEVEYSGFIDNATESRIAPPQVLAHRVQCTDNHYLADKRIIAESYQSTLAGDIVTHILTNYLADEGVTAGTIQDGPVVEEAVFNYVRATDALDSLADKAGFWWNINEDKELIFVDRTTYTAPFTIDGSKIIGEPRIANGNPKYRNTQYIRGGKDVTDSQTETPAPKPDGESRTFTVGYNIADTPTIEVSNNSGSTWATQTVGIRGVDDSKQFYWTKGQNTITQDSAETVLDYDTGDRLRVTYQGLIDIVAITQNGVEIASRKSIEGVGSGIVENVVDSPYLESREAALKDGNSLLSKYAVIGRRIEFATMDSGLAPGQLATINLSGHGLDNAEMLIESIETQDTDGTIQHYMVSAVEGPVNGSWAKVFYEMANRGQSFVLRQNINEDQVLVQLEQYTKTWLETDSPNIFKELYPAVDLFPDATLLPQFPVSKRIEYMAYLDAAKNELGRKALTKQTGETTDEIFTMVYLNPADANGVQIEYVAWYGDNSATINADTGVKVAEEAYSKLKSELEAIQIERTDTKGW